MIAPSINGHHWLSERSYGRRHRVVWADPTTAVAQAPIMKGAVLPTPGQRLVTRRDLLKYGVAGSAVVLLGPLAASSASASARARVSAAARSSNAGKAGGTLRFARSIGPTTLDPANTIIAGDIYTSTRSLSHFT